jgi:hypothetical protein
LAGSGRPSAPPTGAHVARPWSGHHGGHGGGHDYPNEQRH